MSVNVDNRKRAFADLVTVEAWHDAFGKEPKVDLHANVVFGEARVGGEEKSKLRFRLAIKRAELVIVLPETEPVSVDPTTVARTRPEQPRIERTQTLQRNAKATIGATVKGGASLTAPPSFDASVTSEMGAGIEQQEKLALSETVSLMMVTHSQDEARQHRWIIEPRLSPHLKGQPWDPVAEPRLKLKDLRRDIAAGIPPTVRVELRCIREDLIISDITFKDETFMENMKKRFGFENRILAVESYIRDRLLSAGLEVKNIHDAYGHMTIASVTAESA